MKAKFIRDDMQVTPGADVPARLTVERKVMQNGQYQMVRFWKKGAVWEHPDVYWQVRQGTAIPVDEECRDAAGMSEEAMQRAQAAYERTNRGIHPDDYAKYEAGEIAGYDGNGDYIPGPNAKTFSDDDDDDEGDLSGEY